MSVRNRLPSAIAAPLLLMIWPSSKWICIGWSQPPEELSSVQISAVSRVTSLGEKSIAALSWSRSGSQNLPLMAHCPFLRSNLNVLRGRVVRSGRGGSGRN